MKPEPKAQDIRTILNRDGYLIDAMKTVPPDATMLSLLLGVAVDAEVLTAEQAQEQFGDALRASAKTSKDPNLFNVIAYLYVDTKETVQIEEQAWNATKDVRFATGYLFERLKQKSLRSDDPLMAQALKQFPEDSWVMAAAVTVKDAPGEELLVQAIKAEYRHFSPGGLIIPRPSAKALRRYFAQLNRVLGNRAN
jgi:hypothetical protein